MSRISRLYGVAETLRGHAPRLVTVAELARRHGVSPRTIQRDLHALMESGIPVRWQEGRGGGWTVDASMTLPPVNLTEDESVALLLAVRAASGTAPLGRAAQSAWSKISDALDAAGSTAVDRWSRVVAVRATPPEPTPSTQAVEAALRHGHALHLLYTGGSGDGTDRVVEPIGLLTARGDWYLVAWCRTRQAVRGFRLDRIDEATELSETVAERDLRTALLADGVPLTSDR